MKHQQISVEIAIVIKNGYKTKRYGSAKSAAKAMSRKFILRRWHQIVSNVPWEERHHRDRAAQYMRQVKGAWAKRVYNRYLRYFERLIKTVN
jgi:hypothetical protein